MENFTGHVRNRTRKNGERTYQVIIESPPDKTTGKRNRTYHTIHGNKKQAEKYLRDTLAEMENQTYIKPNNVLLKDWLNEWYKDYLEGTLSASTLRGYRYQIDNYLIPMLGNIPIQNLTTLQIQKMVNELKFESPITHKPMSAKSVKNIFMNLSAALEKAVNLDMLKKNPCKKVELPKCEKHEIEVYDEEEVKKLIHCAVGTDMELIIMMSLSLGLRRGEIIALRWSNVDLDNGIVHICENRVEGLDGEVVTKKPKSQAGIRDIPLSSSLIDMLKKYRKQYEVIQARYGVGYKNDDYVICQANGKPYKPFSFTKKFTTFLEKNGLRHIRYHDIRHTNASIMLQQGISPKIAQERLGHSDFAITMNIYSHVTKKVETEAAQKLDDVLFNRDYK